MLDIVHTTWKFLDVEDRSPVGGYGQVGWINAITSQIDTLQLIVVTVGETVWKVQRWEAKVEDRLVIAGTLLAPTA